MANLKMTIVLMITKPKYLSRAKVAATKITLVNTVIDIHGKINPVSASTGSSLSSLFYMINIDC